jgi:hypothetical protein
LRRIHSLLNGQDAHEIDHSQEAIAALTELENEIPHVVFNARLAVISSQVRFNIAEFVVTALQEQGFALETSTYDQNDMRSGYSIQLGNFEGSHVLVQLTPHPSDPIAHDLDIAFRDQDLRTEHEMRQRAGELAVSLNAYGLQLNDLQTLPNTGKPADNSTRSLTRRVHEVKKHYGNN